VTLKRYFIQPLVFEFTATVLEATINDDGTSNVILDQTYFYPTGGGQSHDLGTLGNATIVDVRKDDETIIHVIDGQPITGDVKGVVDGAYRKGNMAAHTGQHILSAICLKELAADTLAVRMNATGLSTVDISVAELSQAQIERIEDQVNQIIQENRPVKSTFVAPDSPQLEKLRRSVKFDKVTGDVRLVDIEGVDLSACAGTHLPTTGMLGLLKILKVDNYKGGSRLHFAAGAAALAQFRMYHQTLDAVSNQLSSGIEQVLPLVEKLQSERTDLNKRIAAQTQTLIGYEASDILKAADTSMIKLRFDNRDNNELKTLANHLTQADNIIVIIANQNGLDCTLIVATSETVTTHAGNTLRAIVEHFGGRGGGRENYAQGVLKDFSDISALMTTVDEKK